MPFSSSVIDRERDKFRQTTGGETSVLITLDNDSISGFAVPKFDEFAVTYPIATQEVYTFKLATVTVAVVTLNYTDATKEFLLNGNKI